MLQKLYRVGDRRFAKPGRSAECRCRKKLNSSLTSDEIIHVATKQDIANKTVTAQNAMNAWKWKANNIPDVTVNVSDHYVWDAGSVMVDDAAQRRASVQAAYNDTAKDFHSMVGFGKHALDWLFITGRAFHILILKQPLFRVTPIWNTR